MAALVIVVVVLFLLVPRYMLWLWDLAFKGDLRSMGEVRLIHFLILAALGVGIYLCRKQRGLFFWTLVFVAVGLAGVFLWMELAIAREKNSR